MQSRGTRISECEVKVEIFCFFWQWWSAFFWLITSHLSTVTNSFFCVQGSRSNPSGSSGQRRSPLPMPLSTTSATSTERTPSTVRLCGYCVSGALVAGNYVCRKDLQLWVGVIERKNTHAHMRTYSHTRAHANMRDVWWSIRVLKAWIVKIDSACLLDPPSVMLACGPLSTSCMHVVHRVRDRAPFWYFTSSVTYFCVARYKHMYSYVKTSTSHCIYASPSAFSFVLPNVDCDVLDPQFQLRRRVCGPEFRFDRHVATTSISAAQRAASAPGKRSRSVQKLCSLCVMWWASPKQNSLHSASNIDEGL